ncbi:MAG TPA: signal peptidase II [Chloroflexota bacterium]|nr:signal peptidase II [Chloroflexota bacterium]
MTGVKRQGIAVLTSGVGMAVVVADQCTKLWAVNSLSGSSSTPSILDGWFSLVLTTNDGAAFGILADRGILFIVVGLVLSGVVLIFARVLPRRRPLLQVSLGLQVGGAVGNLSDRIRVGHVIDFIQIRYWPVFNLADTAIVCGVGLLVYFLLSQPDPRRTHDDGEPVKEPANPRLSGGSESHMGQADRSRK